MIQTPLIEKPDAFITKEDEDWMAKESITNDVISKFYEYYKTDSVNVYKKIYKAMLAKVSKIAEELKNTNDMDKAMDIMVNLGKTPKVLDMYRLLAEGKGYNNLADVHETAEISGKEIVKQALEKNKE